jgi:hypothetical protein
MKFLLVLMIALSSLSAFAVKDPNYCGSEDNCVIGRNMLMLQKGTPYARAEGRSCDEAIENSGEILQHENNCKGTDVQPWGCYKTSRGTTKAWTRCIKGDSSSGTAAPRGKCALIMGVIMC